MTTRDSARKPRELGSAPVLLFVALGFLLAAGILLLGLMFVISAPERQVTPGEKALERGDLETAAALARSRIHDELPDAKVLFLTESELKRNLGQMIPTEPLRSLYLVEPQRRVLSNRPDFRWVTEQQDRLFELRLFAEDGKELWKRPVSGLRAEYPRSEQPLRAGETYAWSLVRGSMHRRGVFQIVDPEARQEIEDTAERLAELFAMSPPMRNFVLGSYFYGEGLYHRAIDHFEALNQQLDQPEIADGLGLLYARVGLVPRVQQLVGRASEAKASITNEGLRD
ncbi:MAG: hypothetical protein RL885_00510 [Planctomycetota bacterium]